MKKYLVEAIFYKKASGSCLSYKGKKATPIIWEELTKEEAENLVKELNKQLHPYKYYDQIKISEAK